VQRRLTKRSLEEEFSEDEMRRPTPHTQYPLGLQMSTGSNGPNWEGGSAHNGW
jgi:hypothetical protein